MKHNQRATITSIDHLKKSFEVKMIHFQFDFTSTVEHSANVLSVPKGKLGAI
jgi:hypothetical protein